MVGVEKREGVVVSEGELEEEEAPPAAPGVEEEDCEVERE